jgi:chaperone LolA
MTSHMFNRLPTVACLLVVPALFPTVAAAGIVDSVRAKYGDNASVQTDVTVTISWKAREKEESRSGRLWLAPGDRFRIEMDNTVWTCDGQTLWQYGAGSGQVIIKRLHDVDLSSHPSKVFATYLTKKYVVASEDQRQAVLVWKADSAAASTAPYREVTLMVDKSDCTITKLSMTDKSGNVNTYAFRKTRFGAIAPEKFVFAVPKGARVLDSR